MGGVRGLPLDWCMFKMAKRLKPEMKKPSVRTASTRVRGGSLIQLSARAHGQSLLAGTQKRAGA